MSTPPAPSPERIPSLPFEIIVRIFSHLPKFTWSWNENKDGLESADVRDGTLWAASRVSRLWPRAKFFESKARSVSLREHREPLLPLLRFATKQRREVSKGDA